ncbi:hypothetical protein CBR_g4143 [Chara braunii]|uniref:Peptidase A2 domain-containing protein n=1 Tax=Chara braunii TaxID=69332 RepID=A0A388KHG6_CHABU|nr:hypothetical protein CBR_g4143 [Chara braunii]|eukprot:GBG69448.1 hypothetical protein CBR_g4143 [Chara braunii]
MQKKYRLGDGLLSMADLEAMNKDDFSTIGAFVHEFKRKARKVHGISEETLCAIFLGLLTGSEASELTSHGGGNEKLTWATIDKGVEEGSLDQVEQHQVRLQRCKRKERDATASRTPGVKRIVTDVWATLGYDNEAEVQKRGVTVAQGGASGAVEEEARREDYGGEETGSQILTKAQRKHRNLQVDLVIKNQKCTGMVDTGAEMNIIREKEAVMIGMEMDRSDHGMLHVANCKAVFCGTTSNVIIEIGKVPAMTCFFVMPDVDHPILRGQSFLCRTKMLIFNKHDGTMILLLCNPTCGNYEIITCRNTGTGSGRNRPNLGSFTFEESENEQRRLWEVPEDEDRAEVLTLSLTDVNKAMEVVSGHDMADPEAIRLAMVQRHMIRAMQTVSPRITQPYIDDLAVKGPKKQEEDEVMPGVQRFVWKHVHDFDQVLGLLEEHNLTASGPKSKHCMREATILGHEENEILVPESRNDGFEEGEIKETFQAEEYDGIYRELGLLLSCEMRDRDASAKAQKMRHLYVLGADQSGPAWYETVEDESEEEPPEPGPEAGSHEPEEPQTEGVITVGDDSPPPTPISEQARQYWPEGILEPDSEEMLGPPPEASTPPSTQVEPEEGERARAPTTVAPQLTEPTGERMDVEVPTSGEPPPGPPPAEEGTSERDPLREGHEARTGKPPGETREEKRARVQVCLEELYQEKLRMEAVGEAPKPPIDLPTSEQRISEAWANYEGERDAARLRSREVGQENTGVDKARETEDLGFSAARMEIERADRRIGGEVAISSFQRYSMLSDELAASRLEVGQLSTQLVEERAENQTRRSRMEAKEAEWEKRLQDMAAMVERLSATKVVDWTEQSQYGIQGKEVQGLFGQEGTTETPQQEGRGKVFLDPTEAAARREAEEKRFSFRTPTELASQQATAMTIEVLGDEPAQGPQPLGEEGGPTEESPTILLEVQEAMELDMPSGGPQRQETPERVPEIGELRTQLGSWAQGADSGEHISEQQQEVMSQPVTVVTPQPSDLHRDEGANAMGGVREGRPLRLDTPAYQPEGGEALAGPSTQMMEAGPAESWSMPLSHEMSRETSEMPSLPGSQKKKRRCRGRSGDQCFFCKDGVHKALECPKFLKDKAAGRVTESGGRMYNRQGRVVERAPDGGRAQLYRQNQEATSE